MRIKLLLTISLLASFSLSAQYKYLNGNSRIATGSTLELTDKLGILDVSATDVKSYTLTQLKTALSANDNLGNHTATQNILLNGNWLSGDGGNEGIFINNDGNVGIGVNTPNSPLHIAGNFNVNGVIFRPTEVSTNTNVLAQPTTNNNRLFFRISPRGVSSVNPVALQIFGTDFFANTTNFEALDLRLDGTGGTRTAFIQTLRGGTGKTNKVHIRTGNTENGIFLDTFNLVGIGTITPTTKLHVAGTGKFTGVLDMTSQKITSLAVGTVSTDAVNLSQITGTLNNIPRFASTGFTTSALSDNGTTVSVTRPISSTSTSSDYPFGHTRSAFNINIFNNGVTAGIQNGTSAGTNGIYLGSGATGSILVEPGSTNAFAFHSDGRFNFPAVSTPASPVTGDVWVNSTNQLRIQQGATSETVVTTAWMKRGTFSGTTDVNGQVTVTHGLPDATFVVTITHTTGASTAPTTPLIFASSDKGATTFKVIVFDGDKAIVPSTAVSFDWVAYDN